MIADGGLLVCEVAKAWGGDGGAFVNGWREGFRGEQRWGELGEEAVRRIDAHSEWLNTPVDAHASSDAGLAPHPPEISDERCLLLARIPRRGI
jgi:hypothetical protein